MSVTSGQPTKNSCECSCLWIIGNGIDLFLHSFFMHDGHCNAACQLLLIVLGFTAALSAFQRPVRMCAVAPLAHHLQHGPLSGLDPRGFQDRPLFTVITHTRRAIGTLIEDGLMTGCSM